MVTERQEVLNAGKNIKRKHMLLIASLGILLPIIMFFLSLMLGRYPLTVDSILRLLTAPLGTDLGDLTQIDYNVFWTIRLPRAIFALLSGGALGMAGCVFQGIFRNPLVSDEIMGVTSGATLGAAVAIILFEWGTLATQIMAFIGGMLTMVMILRLSALGRSNNILSIVLAGIIINSVARAMISLMKYFADPTSTLITLDYWLMGCLNRIGWNNVKVFVPFFVICAAVLIALRWQVNLLSLGDEEATALGVNVRLVRTLMIIASTTLVASVVAMTGIISWIGLIAPHLVRLLMGNDHAKAIPLSFSAGAILMMMADTAARSMLSMELPLSAVVSVFGAPLLGYLLLKAGDRAW